MAKFTMIFENGEIKKVLEFRGDIFEYSMIPTEFGLRGNKPSISSQLEDEISDDIDFGNEEEILAIINYLSEIE